MGKKYTTITLDDDVAVWLRQKYPMKGSTRINTLLRAEMTAEKATEVKVEGASTNENQTQTSTVEN